MDPIDRAAELEEQHRTIALAAQAAKTQQGISTHECQECSEPIPEARRRAIPGCCRCIHCQQEIEQYGKTRLTAR